MDDLTNIQFILSRRMIFYYGQSLNVFTTHMRIKVFYKDGILMNHSFFGIMFELSFYIEVIHKQCGHIFGHF